MEIDLFDARPAECLSELLLMDRQPLGFFLKGAAALVVLLLVTTLMAPRPEVNALRAMIVVGLAIIGLKVLLRRYDIDWPARRHRQAQRSRRSD
jgi:hypothetical protein